MNQYYKTLPGIVLTSSCEEYYLITSKKRMRISETGAYYWSCIQKSMSVEEMQKAVMEEFEISNPEIVESDLQFFLKLLIVKGMIQEKRIKA